MTATAPETVQVALTSTEMVCTPGILRWAANGYKFKRDRKKMIAVIAQTYNLKDEVAKGLLDGSIPYRVEGESVVFEYEKGQYLRS
jgi:hypothetical protein